MTNNSRWKGETVAGVGLDNNTECTKPERNNRDEKYADRLEMFVQNMRDYDVLTYMRRWAACITSDVGITNCR